MSKLRGVYAPVVTPFHANLDPDTERFVAHCRWLVDNGAGLAIFGTNSEAASLSVAERLALTDALLAGGVPAAKLMPGTGSSSLTDAVTLTRHAVAAGAPGVLVLPPFFYKGVSDEGLFAYYSEIIERVADDRLAIYLYHIPQMSYAPISLALIERLLKRYPKAIAGAKDSSGDWDNSKAMIDAYAADGFGVFPASESFLSRAMPLGAAGCISATVNVNPAEIFALFNGWDGSEGAALQAKADAVRKIFQATPMIPAMKYVVSKASGVEDWKVVRPPLVKLDEQAGSALMASLNAVDYRIDGYPRS
ncbi:dihydrodipicolinate synthase family protein [Alcaligenaceae bacterium C4P045]|nr:dihydrodipicolinate synthase family protein [Alcaligenaceae bacterium C4P045]